MNIRLKSKSKAFALAVCAGIVSAVAPLVQSCSEVDCPLDNVVVMTCGLYDANGLEQTLADSLTVTAAGTDSILLNGAQNVSSFVLPMNYVADVDTLIFKFTEVDGTSYIDTLRVSHTNEAHFESLDCPLSFFHEIKDVATTHNAIDSVVVVRKQVNYEDIENLKIYLAGHIE